MFTIAFTGHRPNKLWGYDEDKIEYDILFKLIKNKIIDIIKENKEKREFLLINGMALGADQLVCAASIVVRSQVKEEMKEENKTVYIEAAVPCLNQEKKWPPETQKYYRALLGQVDKITYVWAGEYNSTCMQKRNEYMVDKADVVIAVWDGTRGGTYNCVEYAQLKHKNIIYINPRDIGPEQGSD